MAEWPVEGFPFETAVELEEEQLENRLTVRGVGLAHLQLQSADTEGRV